MKKKILVFFIVIICFSFFLFGVNSSSALLENPEDMYNQTANFSEVAGFKVGGTSGSNVGSLAATIISALLSLLGIIFLGLIIYAGYNWMTAGGEEEKIKKSTDTIKRAIIGLIITLSAYAITYFVFNNFFSGQFTGGTGGSPVGTATKNQ